MIAELFFDVIFFIVDGFLALVPEITWSVDTSAWTFLLDIFSILAYILPWDTILKVVSLIIDIAIIRIVISFIRTVMGLIPFV